MTGAEQLKPFN